MPAHFGRIAPHPLQGGIERAWYAQVRNMTTKDVAEGSSRVVCKNTRRGLKHRHTQCAAPTGIASTISLRPSIDICWSANKGTPLHPFDSEMG